MNSEHRRVIVNLNLPPLQAQALAQLTARISMVEIKHLAVNDEQALDMRNAVTELELLLAAQGFIPR